MLPRRTVTGSEMAYRHPEQYGSPSTVAESCVQRLFHYVIGPVYVMEHRTVQLNPNANDADHQSSDVDDGL